MALVLHHTLVPLVEGCGDGEVNDDEKSHFRHLSIRWPLSCCFFTKTQNTFDGSPVVQHVPAAFQTIGAGSIVAVETCSNAQLQSNCQS